MKTPNYVLIKDKVIYRKLGSGNNLNLPAGSFVRPIYSKYLPMHITDTDEFKFFNEKISVYCYTKHGILLIDKEEIREV